MSDFLNQFASQFQATNNNAFDQNPPDTRAFSDRTGFLKAECKLKEFRPKENEQSHVRLIPWPGVGYFAQKVALHYGIGVEKQTICCRMMLGPTETCMLCKQSRRFYAMGNKNLGYDWAAKQRHAVIVIDRNNMQLGPMIWTIAESTIQAIRTAIKDPISNAVRAIDDLAAGYDIVFKKRKKNDKAPYATIEDIFIANNPTPLGTEEQLKQWLPMVVESPLSQILHFLSDDEIRAVSGLTSDGELPPEAPAQLPVDNTPVAAPPAGFSAPAGFQYSPPPAQAQAPVQTAQFGPVPGAVPPGFGPAPGATPPVNPIPAVIAPASSNALDLEALRAQIEGHVKNVSEPAKVADQTPAAPPAQT